MGKGKPTVAASDATAPLRSATSRAKMQHRVRRAAAGADPLAAVGADPLAARADPLSSAGADPLASAGADPLTSAAATTIPNLAAQKGGRVGDVLRSIVPILDFVAAELGIPNPVGAAATSAANLPSGVNKQCLHTT